MGNCIAYYKIKNKYNNDNLELYTLNGIQTKCKIVDVYDGDTCTAIMYINKEFRKYKIRMFGYDSPEIKPRKNIKNRNKIISDAKDAKSALISKVSNNDDIKLNTKLITIKCYKYDKYGRVLAELFNNKENINNYMINNNFGYIYHGGTKQTL